MQIYRNLVFKGGGVKGIAYTGALLALEKRGLLQDIRRVAGTSSGAVTGAFFALGASPAQMEQIVRQTPYHKFMDGSRWIVGDMQRLFRDYGWFKGDMLYRWVRLNIAALTGNSEITFRELRAMAREDPLRYKDLSVIGANLTLQAPEIFDADRTPDIPICKALRISMSIPLFFAAERLDNGDIVVDGSVTWNYPVSLYDYAEYLGGSVVETTHRGERRYNPETLGIMVETRDSTRAETVRGVMNDAPEQFGGYLRSILGFITDVSIDHYLHDDDWKRTVFIEAHGVRTTDFTIVEELVDMLVMSGIDGVNAHFDKRRS